MPWRLASPWGDSPPRNSWTTWRLNSIECVRCLAMGFLLESPVQLADSQGRHLRWPDVAELCVPTLAALPESPCRNWAIQIVCGVGVLKCFLGTNTDSE